MADKYANPEMKIMELTGSDILTSSAITNTKEAMHSGTLEVNGEKADGSAVVSIEF